MASGMFLWSAIGGVLIGLAAVLLMLSLGRIAGISGIAGGLFPGQQGDRFWRLAFVAGLLMAPLCLKPFFGSAMGIGLPQVGWPWMLAAGLLVGVGTRLGGGCTSGHGVCGVARLSPRSLVATSIFMLSGMAATAVLRHVLGVSLP
jgi:uncharacterized protein